MMKPHFFIYSLLLISSFGIIGCSSNEDISGGENLSAGREVSFSAEAGLAKKISYGTGNTSSIPVYWSANDLIKICSPQSPTASKLAVFKMDAGGECHSSISLNAGETALTWNSSAIAQSFCSFFPSTAATFTGTEGSVVATATLPSAQDGTSGANEFMAGYQYVNTNPVVLQFAPLMNVLRIKIVDSNLNADAAHTISAIVVKSKEVTPKKVAGTFSVGYPSGTVSNLSANSFTSNLSSATGDSILITGSALTSVSNSTLNVTVYLLPQNYSSLKVTVYTNSNKSYVAKTAFSSTTFTKSSVCDLAFGTLDGVTTVPVSNKVDLGCPVGGSGTTPVYFATGNLIVKYDGSGSGTPTGAYIADQANGKFFAMDKTSDYTIASTDTERDLFEWADITGWKSSGVLPANISGNASYDIARALLSSNWRLPTFVEWQWVISNCTWVWTSSYNDTGVAGYTVTGCSNTSVTYDGKDHSNKILFVPAAGVRNNSTDIVGRASLGFYWSGTSNSSNVYHLYFTTSASSLGTRTSDVPYRGNAVRPVTE